MGQRRYGVEQRATVVSQAWRIVERHRVLPGFVSLCFVVTDLRPELRAPLDPRETDFPRRENEFPRREVSFPDRENLFPRVEIEFPRQENPFPDREKPFPRLQLSPQDRENLFPRLKPFPKDLENRFPRLKNPIPRVEIDFPGHKCDRPDPEPRCNRLKNRHLSGIRRKTARLARRHARLPLHGRRTRKPDNLF